MLCCQRDDLIATALEEWIIGDEQCVDPLLDKSCKCRVDVGACPCAYDMRR